MPGCIANPRRLRSSVPLVAAAVLCLPGAGSAQEPEPDDAPVTIMGVVYDVVTGTAIPTAAVSLENGRQGVLTDDQGIFRLEDVEPASVFAEAIELVISLGIFDITPDPDDEDPAEDGEDPAPEGEDPEGEDPDGPTLRFEPGQLMTRGEVAAPLVRLWNVLGNECPRTSIVRFRLADIEDDQVRRDVACLLALRVTAGTTRVTFSPEEPLTRAQIASLLVRMWRASGRECPADDEMPFEDVAADSVHRDSIACLRALAITAGTSPTTFSPQRHITKGQVAAFVARLYEAATTEEPTDDEEPAPDEPN